MSTTSPVIDLALPHLRVGALRGIATLGPAGTSSEQSARYLSDYLQLGWSDRPASEPLPINLFSRYEDAAADVLADHSDLLLVANAYHAVSNFYMDTRLAIVGAYCFDTPEYGIASKTAVLQRRGLSVATHPAPVPIIEQLLAGTGATAENVVITDSTSAAARAAAEGDVDVALTTAPAAELYGLKFLTRTRNIRMIWSVFSASGSETAQTIPSRGVELAPNR